MEGEFYGMVFQDSDVAKWLEGVAYSLVIKPDAALEQRADDIIDIIAKAQQPDGYLNTFFTIKEPEHRWQNLLECHELYCAGHMMEAAVAYYEATGKDKLLGVMERMAQHIMNRFGEDEAHIKLTVRKQDVPYRIDMHLKKNKAKGIAINGIPIRKASELFGIVNVVFFSPEDLNIIKNGPAERRTV